MYEKNKTRIENNEEKKKGEENQRCSSVVG